MIVVVITVVVMIVNIRSTSSEGSPNLNMCMLKKTCCNDFQLVDLDARSTNIQGLVPTTSTNTDWKSSCHDPAICQQNHRVINMSFALDW